MIKSLPKGEIIWVLQKQGKNSFYITSDKMRTKYSLYLICEGGYELLKSSVNPLNFDDIIKKFKKKGG